MQEKLQKLFCASFNVIIQPPREGDSTGLILLMRKLWLEKESGQLNGSQLEGSQDFCF